MENSISGIRRRDMIIGSGAIVLGAIGYGIVKTFTDTEVPTISIDKIKSDIGSSAETVPADWINVLPQIKAGPIGLETRMDRNRITSIPMLPKEYEQVCKHPDRGKPMPKKRFGADILNVFQPGYSPKSVIVTGTDNYTSIANLNDDVNADEKMLVSFSIKNISPDCQFERNGKFYLTQDAIDHLQTYCGMFKATENKKHTVNAWEHIGNVKLIQGSEQELGTKTGFTGLDSKLIVPDEFSQRFNGYLEIIRPDNVPVKIPYSKLKKIAKPGMYENEQVLYIPTEQLLDLAGIKMNNTALEFHANGYASMGLPHLLKDSKLLLNEKYEPPFKFLGNRFAQSAVETHGIRRIKAHNYKA